MDKEKTLGKIYHDDPDAPNLLDEPPLVFHSSAGEVIEISAKEMVAMVKAHMLKLDKGL